MRRNPERRAALVDAAIEVLADEGARGLTFRAVDARAAVPNGTASNYFANRDDLLTQSGGRIYERLVPESAVFADLAKGAHDVAHLTKLMRETVERVATFRTGFLALLELRLEATRRPELRRVLGERVRADLDFNIENHLASGMPGDATTVELLYSALNWMVVDRLTLPELHDGAHFDRLVAAAVERSLPR